MRRTAIFLALIGAALLFVSSSAEAQVKADKRLIQKIAVKADAQRAEDLLNELAEQHKLTIDYHPSFAADAAGDNPITLNVDGISLGAVLQIISEAAMLVTYFDKGKLVVMSRQGDDASPFVRQYPLGPIGNLIDPRELAFGLGEVTSGPWKDVDGEGGEFVTITPQGFTIKQSRRVHAELQEIFDQLLPAAAGRGRGPVAMDRAEQMLIKKLQVPAALPEGTQPLPDLLDKILKVNGIPCWIDTTSMSDEGLDWKTLECRVEPRKLTPAARLDALAAEHQLAWRISDEVVKISSAAKANEILKSRLYDVRRALGPNVDAGALAEQIVANKELGQWRDTDGIGGSVYPVGTLMIIRQTGASHAKLAKLFP